MTDDEFKQLSRYDLILIIYELKKREQELLQEIDSLKSSHSDYFTVRAGSIADAAVEVSGILQAAQKAADNYLDGMRAMSTNTEKRCMELIEKTKALCNEKVNEIENSSKGHE